MCIYKSVRKFVEAKLRFGDARERVTSDMEANKTLCEKKHDFNQNLIEPSKSFEQLCNMINQLEKDSSIEIAEYNQTDLLTADVKYDANLDLLALQNKYPEHVREKVLPAKIC